MELAIDFLENRKFKNIVDIGCGSGILLPTLRLFSKKVIGMDMHNKLKSVKENIGGVFVKGDITKIPFKNVHCICALSILEHVNIHKSLRELEKCLSPEGIAIFGIPSENFFVRLWFKIKKSPALEIHINNKEDIINGIKKYFVITDINELNIGPINLYTVLKCVKR